jgi:hypothetical protein
MTIFDQLGTMLAALPQVISVQTGQITIGRVTYPCARYTELLQHRPGTRAYQEGKRGYTRQMIYCVGMLPAASCRGNVAFKVDGDSRDWYVAGYYGNVIKRKQEIVEPNEYHPAGNMFLLVPWDITDGTKIDSYAKVPYRRMPARLGCNWVDRKTPPDVIRKMA